MTSLKKISILGSTGSIGTSTLDVVRSHAESFQVLGMAAGKNLEVLKKQILEFRPQLVSVAAAEDAQTLHQWKTAQGLKSLEILHGTDGACNVACAPGVQLVIAGMVGAAGLRPTFEALSRGIDIGLANKETLVVAGELMTLAAEKTGAKILPVDSEHNALFQSMVGHNRSEIHRLILTASGGPFRNTSVEALHAVTPEQALKHPNWDMGSKITIDSATMMNKGLEVIEAHFLFGLPPEKIDILVHPQSIVHSLVEYIDGSLIAQLGIPDMRIPISYAMAYPNRLRMKLPQLDLVKAGKLEFFPPDPARFPAINLAYQALRRGDSMPAVLNAANEVAIPQFLKGKIRFTQIPDAVLRVMEAHEKQGCTKVNSIDGLLEADRWARMTCEQVLEA